MGFSVWSPSLVRVSWLFSLFPYLSFLKCIEPSVEQKNALYKFPIIIIIIIIQAINDNMKWV